MAPYLSWRQARIIELLGNGSYGTAADIAGAMLDPLGVCPTASVRRDLGVLRDKGYGIEQRSGKYVLVSRPEADTTPVTTPDDVYATA